jgi:enterochelin esterase-like enzyme
MRTLEETLVPSASLGRNRAVWVDSPDGLHPRKLCVILDAESYLCNVGLGAIIAQAEASGEVGAMSWLFVPFVTPETRHTEYACHPGFAQFLADDLMTWAKARFPSLESGGHAMVGLSLSGLQAAFTALRHPGVFTSVVCQSPSAWYRDEYLRDQVDPLAAVKADFRISVGSEETTFGEVHEPGALHQKISQLDSCQRLSKALESAGHAVDFSVFEGDHDNEFWTAEMPEVLKWIWERV